jgi:hypothetical protein
MSTPVNALRSPEMNPDYTVKFRFRAPEATKVELAARSCRARSAGDVQGRERHLDEHR